MFRSVVLLAKRIGGECERKGKERRSVWAERDKEKKGKKKKMFATRPKNQNKRDPSKKKKRLRHSTDQHAQMLLTHAPIRMRYIFFFFFFFLCV
jgi:hypothetical protein